MPKPNDPANSAAARPAGDDAVVTRHAPEPGLEEMLDDPVIQAIMARDGARREEIINLVVSAVRAAFPGRGPAKETPDGD